MVNIFTNKLTDQTFRDIIMIWTTWVHSILLYFNENLRCEYQKCMLFWHLNMIQNFLLIDFHYLLYNFEVLDTTSVSLMEVSLVGLNGDINLTI